MKTSRWKILAGALALAAGGAGLHAQEIDVQISTDFVGIVGSEDQARALVVGLRNGTPVTLSARDGRSVTITPVSGPMGWGDAYIAVSLAQEELQQFGITNPTVIELAVALNGGELVINGSRRHVDGILRVYASAGDDWDHVARTVGVSFDPVREHWRTYETRFGASGGSARLEEKDKPRGEANWSRESGDNRDREQPDQSRQNAQYQDQQNPGRDQQVRDEQARDQQNMNREPANAQDQQSRQDERDRERDQQKAGQYQQNRNGDQQQYQPRDQRDQGGERQTERSNQEQQNSDKKDQEKKDQEKKKSDQQQDDTDHPHGTGSSGG